MQRYKKLIMFMLAFLFSVLTVFIVIICIYSNREKNFKSNIRQAEKVSIMSGSTGESIVLSKEDIEKLANKIDEANFKPVLFPKQYNGWSYEISYASGDDNWSMLFGKYAEISQDMDNKNYQYSHDLVEFVGNMYKELGGK